MVVRFLLKIMNGLKRLSAMIVIYFDKYSKLSMGDSSNGRAVALYPADPGSNPRSGSV